eukprot:1157009-Pelagomonas_calceolata.AAC.1
MCQGIFKDETVRLMTFRKCEIALQDLAYVIVMAKHEKTEASGTHRYMNNPCMRPLLLQWLCRLSLKVSVFSTDLAKQENKTAAVNRYLLASKNGKMVNPLMASQQVEKNSDQIQKKLCIGALERVNAKYQPSLKDGNLTDTGIPSAGPGGNPLDNTIWLAREETDSRPYQSHPSSLRLRHLPDLENALKSHMH